MIPQNAAFCTINFDPPVFFEGKKRYESREKENRADGENHSSGILDFAIDFSNIIVYNLKAFRKGGIPGCSAAW